MRFLTMSIVDAKGDTMDTKMKQHPLVINNKLKHIGIRLSLRKADGKMTWEDHQYISKDVTEGC